MKKLEFALMCSPWSGPKALFAIEPKTPHFLNAVCAWKGDAFKVLTIYAVLLPTMMIIGPGRRPTFFQEKLIFPLSIVNLHEDDSILAVLSVMYNVCIRPAILSTAIYDRHRFFQFSHCKQDIK